MPEEKEPSHEKSGFFAGWKAQVQGFAIGAILTGVINYFWVGMRMERNDQIDVSQEEKIEKGQKKDESLTDIDREYEKRITTLEGKVENLKERRK